jgi:ATP adenylyltransferase
MDHLWTPWRFTYVTDAAKNDRCIFCDLIALGDDEKALIVRRGERNFIVLNRFPYTTGHVMIVPYAHVADLAACDSDVLNEMMQMARRLQLALGAAYKPDGYNIGMNLGRCAGAGVTGHVHMHVLPRWTGDSNFMTVTSETRVQPEDLSATFEKLRAALAS